MHRIAGWRQGGKTSRGRNLRMGDDARLDVNMNGGFQVGSGGENGGWQFGRKACNTDKAITIEGWTWQRHDWELKHSDLLFIGR